MPDITATINAKGLDKTGFDDDLIAELFHRKVGRHMLAIVEVQIVDKRGPNIKGKSKVLLDITSIDPITDDNLDEHIREIQKTLAYNRGLQGHTGTTTQGQEPTVHQVLAAGQKHKPHPFLPVDAADENPICDVCGQLETAAVHSVQEILDQPDDDEPGPEDEGFAAGVDEEPYDHDPEFAGPHAYDAGPDDVCQCGLPFEDDIHATTHPRSTVPDPFAVTS
jgi:hypothetical protein